MTYTIRPAQADDLAALLQLRNEASAWLESRGIDQWTRDMSSLIEERLEDGHTWLLDADEHAAVATVTLAGPDLDFWRVEDDPENALYVYKLIVRRDHAGRWIGDRILDWASDRTARSDRAWLRLDCDRDNTGLHDYYRRRGFTHLRTVCLAHRQSGALFQRPATRSTRPVFHETNGEVPA